MILCTDLHFNKNNYMLAGEVFKQALSLARETNASCAFLGDLNDTKANMRGEWVNLLLSILKEYSDVQLYVLVGNHDLLNVKNDSKHCLEFLRDVPNVTLIDNNLSADKRIFEGIGFIPYKNDAKKINEDISTFKEVGTNILFMHQGITGGLQNAGRKDTDGYPKTRLKGLTVFCGHYHMPHDLGEHIHYIGSSLSHSWGEANQSKYLVDLDPESGIYEKLPLDIPLHISYTITPDSCPDMDKHKGIDYIRVVLRGPKEWIKGYNLGELEKELGKKPKIVYQYDREDKEFKYSKEDNHTDIIQNFIKEQKLRPEIKSLVEEKALSLFNSLHENK